MTTLFVADLLGSTVMGPNGSRHGKVVDLVVSEDGTFRIKALVVGRRGWIERLNMANALRSYDPGDHRDRIDWSMIERIEPGRIYLGVRPDDPTRT